MVRIVCYMLLYQCVNQPNNDVWKKYESPLHVAEMMMLRWVEGNTEKDHARNQFIQDDTKVYSMTTFLRQKKATLVWSRQEKRGRQPPEK